MVITAERRDQDAQDLGLAATVLDGEALVDQGVTNIDVLQRVSPSIAINKFNRSTFVNIRGVGIAQSSPTAVPGVAVYVDGAPVPHEQFIGHSFFDIDSIEVLRGPQGTLTGQNSTGGALYLRSPDPDFRRVAGYLDQTIGDYGWSKTEAAVNVPLDAGAALRVSAVSEDRDSFTRNIGASGSQPGSQDFLGARANLEWRPSDQWTVNVRYELFDLQTDNLAVKRRGDTVSTNPYVIQEDARSYLNQAGNRISGEVKYDFADSLQLRFITSSQYGTTKDQADGDRTDTAAPRPPAGNVGRVSFARTEFDTNTYELNLLTTGDAPLQWIAGAFYLDEDVPLILLRDNTHTNDLVTAAGGSDIRLVASNTSASVFGQADYDFSNQWQGVIGLRYSEDQQVLTRTAGPPPALGTSTQTSSETTGRLGLNFHPVDDVMLYASLSRGYKAGGVNLILADPHFEPETNSVFELGAKTQIFDNRLQINGDVFVSDYRDLQLFSLRNGLPVTQNAASGESVGAELEVRGEFDDLQFNGAVGWLDAQFAENVCLNDANSAPAVTDAGCPAGNRLAPGGRVLPFSPAWTLNAGVQYDFRFDNGIVITPRLQVAHTSDQYATPFPSALTLAPARTLWDLRVNMQVTQTLSVEAFAENLTDEIYIASQIQNATSADGGILYGAPRTFGLRARLKFG